MGINTYVQLKGELKITLLTTLEIDEICKANPV